jgi:hypothetical protein
MASNHDSAGPRQAGADARGNRRRRLMAHRIRVAVSMVLLTVTAAAQRFVAMPRWSAVLGRPAAVPDAWRSSPVISLPSRWDSPAELQAARAVHAAGRHLPWKPKCLAEAATAQLLLRAMGSPAVVVIGLRPPPTTVDAPSSNHGAPLPNGGTPAEQPAPWEAHAWLVGRSGAITGGPAARGFTPTTVFEVPGRLTAAEVAAGQPSP